MEYRSDDVDPTARGLSRDSGRVWITTKLMIFGPKSTLSLIYTASSGEQVEKELESGSTAGNKDLSLTRV